MREFKRERGFLTVAENNDKVDYLRLAYGLALSLQATQQEIPYLSVAVTPGTKVPDKYKKVFDEVIELPWVDNAAGESWKLENEWKTYHITPYQQTIKLDADMLFFSDITDWWDLLALRDFWATTKVKTYRNELVTSDYHRKLFTSNNLPNVYTAFTFFQYSDRAQEIFELVELIYHNHVKFFYEYLDELRPEKASTDVVFALAIKLLDLEDECCLTFDDLDIPTFVHMRPQLQRWNQRAVGTQDDWQPFLNSFFTDDCELKVGTFKQTLPFHYMEKSFLTDQKIEIYENWLREHGTHE